MADVELTTAAPLQGGGIVTLLEVFDPRNVSDPYPAYRRWRELRPVWQGDERLFVFSRHRDCAAVLRDSRFGHAEDDLLEPLGNLEQGGLDMSVDLDSMEARSFLFLNPPDHTRLRRLVSSAFTPKRVEALAPRIEQITSELLDAAQAAQSPIDLIDALASPLPVIVIGELLGIPLEDRPRLVEWSHAMARGLDPAFLLPPGVREEQTAARLEFSAYLSDLVAERRRKPGEDLLSALVGVRDSGDVLSEDELVATSILILIAGHETTTNLIGNGVLALLREPDQLARLREAPDLVGRAVEELLRYDSVVQLTARTALHDVEVAGATVPRGAFVLLLVGAANRDPEAHPDPDRLDIGREPTRHLAFGQGIHFCMGAPLARLEAQVALRAVTQRFGGLHLEGEPTWKETAVLRGLRTLPVGQS
ncbi:MAG: cytochrome P450 [Acidimicrobiales bacterium]